MEVEIKTTQKINITEEDFKDYEIVRSSGVINMFDIGGVCGFSENLTREKCLAIMKNYDELMEEYPEVRN